MESKVRDTRPEFIDVAFLSHAWPIVLKSGEHLGAVDYDGVFARHEEAWAGVVESWSDGHYHQIAVPKR